MKTETEAMTIATPMISSSRAYWVTGPMQGELREEPLESPGPGHALVRTL